MLGWIGLQPECRAVGLDCCIQISFLFQCVAEAPVDVRLIRCQRQDRAVLPDGAVQIAFGLEGHTQVIHCLRKVGLEFQCFTIIFDGAVQVSFALGYDAHIVIGRRVHKECIGAGGEQPQAQSEQKQKADRLKATSHRPSPRCCRGFATDRVKRCWIEHALQNTPKASGKSRERRGPAVHPLR